MEQHPEPVPAQIPLPFPPGSRVCRPARQVDHQPERLRFRRVPLLAAACSFAAGIALAHLVYQPLSVLLVLWLACVLLTCVALWKSLRVAIAPAVLSWAVLGLLAAQWPRPPAPAGNVLQFADGLSRQVRGTVTGVRVLAPELATPSPDADAEAPWEMAEAPTAPNAREALQIDLDTQALEQVTPDVARMVPASGTVRLSLYVAAGQRLSLGCGDSVELTARLRPMQRFRDPGAWQYADYLAQQGIVARGTASASSLQEIGHTPPALACRLQAARQWAATRLLGLVHSPENRHLPTTLRLSAADAGMVDAMLLGDRSELNRTLRTAFERTGSFHLFVVSGVHVALLAGLLFFLARKLRAPEWLATLVTIPLATLYAVFTGFGAPVERSLAMVTVYLLARLLLRERSSLNALGAAVLLMLLWSPRLLFDTGFQMTLLAVIAIAGLGHPLAQWLLGGHAEAARDVFQPRRRPMPPSLAAFRLRLEVQGAALAYAVARPGSRAERIVRRLPAWLVRGSLVAAEFLLLGVVAELVMVLPMALYFHRATPFSLLANSLVIPLVGVLAPLAVLTFAAALLGPAVAVVPAAVLAGLLHLVSSAVLHLGHVPGADLRVPSPRIGMALLAVALWLVGCWAVRRSRVGALVTALALPCIAALVLWPEPMERTPGTLEVTAIDVGQGDSLLLVSPHGQTMLVDAGGPIGSHGVQEVVSRFDIGEEVVSPYLWSRYVRRLDVVVLSHAHTDHMGGMAAVLRSFRPRELWVGIDPHSMLYSQLLAEAASLGITVRHLHAGDHTTWGGLPVEVLAPGPSYRNPGPPKNDDSLVLRLRYGQSTALLEGDAERPSEDTMLAAGLIGPVTLLKVGHHGSNTSSTPEFLAAAAPQVALLSSGAGNPFGHPRAEVIDRFAALGIPLLRTDHVGLSTVLLTPDGHFRKGTQGVLFPPLHTLSGAATAAGALSSQNSATRNAAK